MSAQPEFNVAVLTATTRYCRMEYTQALCRLAMYFAQFRIFDEVEKQTFVPDAVIGSGIGANYESMVAK